MRNHVVTQICAGDSWETAFLLLVAHLVSQFLRCIQNVKVNQKGYYRKLEHLIMLNAHMIVYVDSMQIQQVKIVMIIVFLSIIINYFCFIYQIVAFCSWLIYALSNHNTIYYFNIIWSPCLLLLNVVIWFCDLFSRCITVAI